MNSRIKLEKAVVAILSDPQPERGTGLSMEQAKRVAHDVVVKVATDLCVEVTEVALQNLIKQRDDAKKGFDALTQELEIRDKTLLTELDLSGCTAAPFEPIAVNSDIHIESTSGVDPLALLGAHRCEFCHAASTFFTDEKQHLCAKHYADYQRTGEAL